MTIRVIVGGLLFVSLLAPAHLMAGSYYLIVDKTLLYENNDPNFIGPFALVHPPGFDGTPDALNVFVCVDAASPELIGPTQEAMKLWNRRQPAVGNCTNCRLWEEPEGSGSFDAISFFLHEIGHCGIGLDHVNLHESCGSLGDPPLPANHFRTGACSADNDGCCKERTSYTSSAKYTRVLSSTSLIGDAEDMHINECPFMPAAMRSPLGSMTLQSALAAPEPGTVRLPSAPEGPCQEGVPCPPPPECCAMCPGKQCPLLPLQVEDLAWYRLADNDPFVVDGVVIDRTTYSRSALTLPGADNYMASGNRAVGTELGYPADTQAVMYSRAGRAMVYDALAADDVNMVRMGMTGDDRFAGTADDYAVQLIYQHDCTTPALAHIVAYFDDTLPGSGILGGCDGDIELSYPQGGFFKFHYSVVKRSGNVWINIPVNPGALPDFWDFGAHLFSAGFESGDFREWADVSP